jgi:ectoine hydroxylase-related dioxygenase (phytanoyl-CoA dioxygenase family)
LRRLQTLLDPLFLQMDRLPEEWVHDLGEPSPSPSTSIPEVVFTAQAEPRIRLTRAYRTMSRIAAQLLGRPATISFDHAILKPAHNLAYTPWHQDFAFNTADLARTVNFWIPLTDVTPENGCMRFIPRSHRDEPLAHVVQGSDALHAVGVPEERMVVCPIPAGGFTVHTQRTLHSSGPNSSDSDRLAWIVKFKADERTTAQQLAERVRTLRRAGRRAVSERIGLPNSTLGTTRA